MIILNVHAIIKAEHKADYLAAIAHLSEKSNQEAGCLMYEHYAKVGSEIDYLLVEHWQDQAALDAHNQTAHFKSFIKAAVQWGDKLDIVQSEIL